MSGTTDTRTNYDLKLAGIESGSAGVNITLKRGVITVTHGSCGSVLREIKDAKDGSWDKLWDAIDEIEKDSKK